MPHYPEKTETDEILSSFNVLSADLEHRINWGADASKPSSPSEGDRYIALDTNKLYLCYSAGSWTEFTGGGVHTLGGASHTADTLANLNTKISNANLDNERTLAFFIPTADISAGSNVTYEIYVPFLAGLTILKVYITAKVAPGTGKTVTIDINKNGTTIFTTQGNRPSITNAEKINESGTPDVTALAKNDIVTVDIDVATADHEAENITVEVRCKIT